MSNSSPPKNVPCNPVNDDTFGPAVQCSQFDFTLYFEQAIFSIGISSLFLILFIIRLGQLLGKSIKTLTTSIYWVKLGVAVAISALQLAALVLWTKNPITRLSVPSAILTFIGALALLVLVAYEHGRSVSPSAPALLYLLASLLAEAVEIRTLYLRNYVVEIARLTCASLACKVVLLILEALSKKSILKPSEEDYSPDELANVFSRSTFFWLNRIMLRGNKKILTIEDLYPLNRSLYSDKLQKRILRSWEKHGSKSAYSFLYAHLACFKWEVLRTMPPRLAQSGFTYAQTFLINGAILYMSTPANLRDVNRAYGLIGATVLIYMGIAISTAVYNQQLFYVTSGFRGATSALIYNKLLVRVSGYNEMAAVTLMSTDIDRMAMSLTMSSDLWARIIEVGVGVYLLYRQLGAVCIAPIIIVFLCFLLQSWQSKYMGPRQARWVQAVQRRVAISSSVLRAMKSIKLSGLVTSMADLVQSERVRELKMAKKFRSLQVWVNTTSSAPTAFSALVTFAVYEIRAKIAGTPLLTTAQAFTAFSILTLLAAPAQSLLSSIPQLTSAMGCARRVHKFIFTDPFEDPRDISDGGNIGRYFDDKGKSDDRDVEKSDDRDVEKSSQASDVPTLSVSNLVLAFLKSSDKSAQNAITFEAGRGTLTTVLGPVGCGKSTLLRTILGEIKPASGTVSVCSPYIAYCSQSAWIPNATIRDAIIGENEYDDAWYQKIIDICELESDFSQMPNNDETAVGSRGIVLSGGQKHRVGLARALYSRCSVLLLDDFLSSLDRKTRDSVVIKLFAKDGHIQQYGLTAVLATHTSTYVNYSTNIIVMQRDGSLEYLGAPEKWEGSDKDISMTHDLDEGEEKPPRPLFPARLSTLRKVGMAPGTPTLPMSPTSAMVGPAAADTTETVKRQSGDWGVWVYYAKAIHFLPLLLALAFILINVFCQGFPRIWLQYNTGDKAPSVQVFIGTYFLVSIVGLMAQAGTVFQFMMIIGPGSGIRLHDILVRSSFRAPMSYFESTDSSILLNRFSQDMSLIDMQLPMSGFGAMLSIFSCLMNIILICLGSTYIAATIPVTLMSIYWIQRFYLRTSRQMRLLDLEWKSPIYQQFTETLEGLETIRAFGWQELSNKEAMRRLNTSQRPYYLLFMIQRWLNFALDSLVASLAILLVSIALCVPSSSSGGAIGVALTSVLGFNTSLKILIMTWTGLETSLGSVARTQSFEKYTPSEDQDESLDPGTNWPQGEVEVSNMSLTYGDGTVALRNVSFRILKGQKWGICGRTGSGKSTLLSSFLRLVDPNEGKIIIDGVDISKVERNNVRDRLICLPQDPLIFPGTFRFNLDPTSKISDDGALTKVLENVHLWPMVEKRGGLMADLKIDTLSHGEQQLLALARSILRKQITSGHCILILDEATSNLDMATESLIQAVIKEQFKDTTVITVAHRLDTVRESDYILMLEKGEVVKIGTPAEVL